MRLLLLLGLLGVYGQKKSKWPDRAYTLTNEVANAVVVLQLDPWGNLNHVGSVPTGGMGSGSGLGNQGALASWKNFLFVVNPGSNTITTLWLDPDNKRLPTVACSVGSYGTSPRSLTVWGNWLFVLNSDSVVGFKIWPNGQLTMVPSSWVSAASDGNVQVQFNNNGRWLVVAMRGTTSKGFWVLPVNQWGVVSAGTWTESLQHVPFGFDIDKWDRIFASEVPTNSLSSWKLHGNGTLQFIDREDTLQLGTCWATLHPNGKWAYAANAGSATISGVGIDEWAKLWLLDANGVTASQANGSHTTDLDISGDGSYLYSLGTGVVYAYWIDVDGHLTRVGWWQNSTALPKSVTGMHVPTMQTKPSKASKKAAWIGGIAGGAAAVGAAFLVVRRKRNKKAMESQPKPIEIVAVHV
jgi:6-phosphogluconolactonase (cycloisomerase 2 family)